jgi:hypothetical protein
MLSPGSAAVSRRKHHQRRIRARTAEIRTNFSIVFQEKAAAIFLLSTAKKPSQFSAHYLKTLRIGQTDNKA